MKNFGLKLLSIGIAILLTIYVNSEANISVRAFFAPIEVQNLPPEKMILLPVLLQTQVKVRGPAYLVSQIAASPPIVKLKLPDEIGRKIKLVLQASDLSLPPSVRVDSLEPSELDLVLDNRVTKSVPVAVPTIGSLPANYKLEAIEISPVQVEVSGAEAEVKNINTVETYPLDLREIKKSEEQELSLKIPGKYTSLGLGRVTALVKVSVIPLERKFSGLKIEVRSVSGESFTLSPGLVNVEISGPKSVVELVKPEEIVPYVKLKENTPSGELAQVLFDLPKDVFIVQAEPDKVKIQKIDGKAGGKPVDKNGKPSMKKVSIRNVSK